MQCCKTLPQCAYDVIHLSAHMLCQLLSDAAAGRMPLQVPSRRSAPTAACQTSSTTLRGSRRPPPATAGRLHLAMQRRLLRRQVAMQRRRLASMHRRRPQVLEGSRLAMPPRLGVMLVCRRAPSDDRLMVAAFKVGGSAGNEAVQVV